MGVSRFRTAAKPAPAKPPPSASAAPPSPPKPARGGTGRGGKSAGGEKKTAGEKVAAELAVAGAIATGQMNEDLKSSAGKKYGIPGGKNANGPNHPVAQAAAGVTLIALGVLSPDKLAAKLKDAVAKKTPLLLSATTLTKDGIEKLLKKHGAHALADAMWVNGTVGPYSVMRKFTAKLGGAYQAHHLIEQRFYGDIPCVRKFESVSTGTTSPGNSSARATRCRPCPRARPASNAGMTVRGVDEAASSQGWTTRHAWSTALGTSSRPRT